MKPSTEIVVVTKLKCAKCDRWLEKRVKIHGDLVLADLSQMAVENAIHQAETEVLAAAKLRNWADRGAPAQVVCGRCQDPVFKRGDAAVPDEEVVSP